MARLSLRLCVEHLESRLLLAGNVSVEVIGGDLVITGDGLDNEIEIEQTGAGEYTVTGVGGTTVEGGADFVANGVDDDFKITMGDGHDIVHILDTTEVPDDLIVDMGAGNDEFQIGEFGLPMTVNGNAMIKTGAGDDEVKFWYETHVLGKATVDTGAGEDEVQIWNDTVIEGKVSIKTGAGNDIVYVWNDSQLHNQLRVQTGDGNDIVYIWNDIVIDGKVRISTGDGMDVVEIQHNAILNSDVRIDTGDDNDTVDILNEAQFGGKLQVRTQDGNDIVNVDGDGVGMEVEVAGKARIDTGRGEDDVLVREAAFLSKLKLDGKQDFDELLTDLVEGGPIDFKNFEMIGLPP